MASCPIEVTGWITYLSCHHPTFFLLAVSAVFAGITIIYNVRLSKNTVSYQSMRSMVHDKAFINTSILIKDLHTNNKAHLTYLGDRNNIGKMTAADKKDADRIRIFCNDIETIAIGIKQGIFRESVIKSGWRSFVVHKWIQCKPFIDATRLTPEDQNALGDFQALAKKWHLPDFDKPLV